MMTKHFQKCRQSFGLPTFARWTLVTLLFWKCHNATQTRSESMKKSFCSDTFTIIEHLFSCVRPEKYPYHLYAFFSLVHPNECGFIESSYPWLVIYHSTGYPSTNNNEKMNKTQYKHCRKKKKRRPNPNTAPVKLLFRSYQFLFSRCLHWVCVFLTSQFSIHIKLICI